MHPADLTVSQILAVFEAIRTVRDMAVKGLSARDAAKAMYWRVEDIRTAAALMGFSLSEHVTRQEVCPVCGHLLMPDRHCEICALRTRLARLHAVNEIEHNREVRRLEDEIDAVKQKVKRARIDAAVDASTDIVEAMLQMKDAYLRNPRSRERDWRWFELAARRMRRIALQQASSNTCRTRERLGTNPRKSR